MVIRLCCLLVLCALVPALAADWPQWQGPARDGCSAETGLLPAWPAEGPRQLWLAEGLGMGYGSAAIAGGHVYVMGKIGEDGVLTAIDLRGQVLWRKTYGAEWDTPYPGARGTPTVVDGRAYVLAGKGRLTCFDAITGAEQWSVDLVAPFGGKPSGWGYAESPLVVDGVLYCTPGGAKAAMVALNAGTGETIWQCGAINERASACTPALARLAGRNVLVTTFVRSTVGVDAATGALLWTYDSSDKRHLEDAVAPNTPVVRGREILTAATREKGGARLTMAQDGAAIAEAWTNKQAIAHHGGMLLADGRIYLSPGGPWVALSWDTGAVIGTDPGVGKGTAICADGRLYAYGEKGELALMQPTPDGLKTVSKTSITYGAGLHVAHLALSDGVLYVRHGDALAAYAVK